MAGNENVVQAIRGFLHMLKNKRKGAYDRRGDTVIEIRSQGAVGRSGL
jgi:hypothetical protein